MHDHVHAARGAVHRARVTHVADLDLGARQRLRLVGAAHQSPHAMPARDQPQDQRPADEA